MSLINAARQVHFIAIQNFFRVNLTCNAIILLKVLFFKIIMLLLKAFVTFPGSQLLYVTKL